MDGRHCKRYHFLVPTTNRALVRFSPTDQTPKAQSCPTDQLAPAGSQSGFPDLLPKPIAKPAFDQL